MSVSDKMPTKNKFFLLQIAYNFLKVN
jgi:hypothetical protein